MTTFTDLEFLVRWHGASQALAFFPNGFGASVTQKPIAPGETQGVYWLTILKGDSDNYTPTSSILIGSDALGNLTEAEVTSTLAQIQNLQ